MLVCLPTINKHFKSDRSTEPKNIAFSWLIFENLLSNRKPLV